MRSNQAPRRLRAEIVEPPAVHRRKFQPAPASAPRRLQVAEGRKLGTSGGAAFVREGENRIACSLTKGVGKRAGLSSGPAGRRLARGLPAGSTLTPQAGLEIDARIDPGVSEIGDQINDKADQGEDIEVGEDHRIIALNEQIIGKIAEAVERKHLLDQERAGEEGGDEGAGESCDDDQHRIAKHVAVEHAPLAQALHARSLHIGLLDLVEKRVFRQERRGGEEAKTRGGIARVECPR